MAHFIINVDAAITFNATRLNILFGINYEKWDSVSNYTLLTGKEFIWKTKQHSNTLFFPSFRNFFKTKLTSIKLTAEYKNDHSFAQWDHIYNAL